MSNPARKPIVVTHDGGVRFTAQIRSHRLTVDQPVAAGGDPAEVRLTIESRAAVAAA